MSSFFVAAKTSAVANAQANLITAAGVGFTSAFERGIQLVGETDPNAQVGRMTNLNITDGEFAAFVTLCAAEIAASTMFGGSYSLADTLTWMSDNNLKFQPTGLDFEPTVVDNCIAWFDSNYLLYNASGSLAINGEAVKQWQDRAGFTVILSQTNSIFQPALTIGTTNQYLSFDGTNDYMYVYPGGLALSGDDTPYTMFTLFQLGASVPLTFQQSVLSFGTTTGTGAFIKTQINQMTNFRYARKGDTGSQDVKGAGTPDLNPFIKTEIFGGQTVIQRLNATLSSRTDAINVPTMTIDTVTLGADTPPLLEFFNGRIYSVITFNRLLSPAEYSFVEGYLFKTYNLI
jgi:hypothetical protein